jgi:hypothetical protein
MLRGLIRDEVDCWASSGSDRSQDRVVRTDVGVEAIGQRGDEPCSQGRRQVPCWQLRLDPRRVYRRAHNEVRRESENRRG